MRFFKGMWILDHLLGVVKNGSQECIDLCYNTKKRKDDRQRLTEHCLVEQQKVQNE